MRRLIVFRHAKSSWRDSSIADHERPLSSRGRRDAPVMAERIVGRDNWEGGVILTSTARRARETASALAEAAGDDVRTVVDGRLYHADPATIADCIIDAAAPERTVIVVGHNPGLSDFVHALAPAAAPPNLPTAGVVSLRLPLDDWTAFDAARAEFEWFDYPRRAT